MADEQDNVIHLDYFITSPEERTALVHKIVNLTSPEKLTPRYINILTEYILDAVAKQEKKEKNKTIISNNRQLTLNKRETSYQGLVAKLENGEDGLYNMITNDKNIIFTPKVKITPKDIEEIPALAELTEAIAEVEEKFKKAKGKDKYLLKTQLIQMYQDQYVIKNSYNPPMYINNVAKNFSKISFAENIAVDANGDLKSDGFFSMLNPQHISLLLCHYSQLKEEVWGCFTSDAYYLMMDLDSLIEKTFKKDYPLYLDLIIHKIDKKTNQEIQELLYYEYGIKYSIEHISSLWRNKIPKMLAEAAKDEWLTWHYTTEEYGKWKRCSKCGQIKLAHNRFFSKNGTSRDGFYSICKKCRNKKPQQRRLTPEEKRKLLEKE